MGVDGVYVFTVFISDVAIVFENMVNDVFGEMFHIVYNWLLLICLFVYWKIEILLLHILQCIKSDNYREHYHEHYHEHEDLHSGRVCDLRRICCSSSEEDPESDDRKGVVSSPGCE